MRATSKRQYESIVSLLAQCEDKREAIESTPLGTQLLGELKGEATHVADLFKAQSNGRNAVHDAAAKRRTNAHGVRRSATALARHARALAPTAGLAIELPPLRKTSDQQLIADARATLDAVHPLADTFKAGKLTGHDDLAKQIADLDAAMKDQSTGRETHIGASATITGALRECRRLVAAIEPFYLQAINGDPELTARWKNAKRVGPARPRTDAAPAPATETVPEKSGADKVA